MINKLSPYLDVVLRGLGGNFRISKRGVPHIVLKTNKQTYSICWFKRSRIYRLFYLYPTYLTQTKVDFNNFTDLQKFFLSKEGEYVIQ